MRKRTSIAGLLLAGAAATMIGAGPASAAQPDAHLRIVPGENGNYVVTVLGESPEPQSAIDIMLLGEDRFNATLLYDGVTGTSFENGLYKIRFTVPGSVLDEDLGEDEILAKVHMTYSAGTAAVLSNTVTGSY